MKIFQWKFLKGVKILKVWDGDKEIFEGDKKNFISKLKNSLKNFLKGMKILKVWDGDKKIFYHFITRIFENVEMANIGK
jgi:hypothetical protein